MVWFGFGGFVTYGWLLVLSLGFVLGAVFVRAYWLVVICFVVWWC